MGSKGIKSHITIILATLLTIGMLLISMVVTIFWQRSLMTAEREKALSLLSAVADIAQETTAGQEILSQAVLTRLQNDLNARCIILSRNNIVTMVPESCGEEGLELQQSLKQAITLQAANAKSIKSGPELPFISRTMLIAAAPLTGDGAQGGIGVVISLQPIHDQISQGRQIAYIYILVNTIILTTIGLFRFIQVVVRPIEHLVTLTNTYQSDESNPFYSDKEGNEFGQLSLALNSMLHRIDDDRQKLLETVGSLEQANEHLRTTQQRMVQTEKMAAIGRLAAGLAHEIGNPIGIVQGYLEMLGQAGLSPEEQQQFSSRSMQELGRINRLIQQLLNFSRTRPDNSGSAQIHPLLQELVDMLQAQKKLAGIEFQLQLEAEDDQVAASAESLHQVFLNCLLNAIDAVKDGDQLHKSKICLKTANMTNNEGKHCIQIAIEDNGMGIKDADRDSLFDPFFTTKEPGKGTGLGLSVSYALVENACGQMRIDGEEGNGATVLILLPLQDN